MGAKVTAFLIALVVMIFLAVAGFIVLILALNGYSESDATYSFGVYGIFAFLLVFAGACVAGGVAHLLTVREFKPTGTVMISVIVAAVFGFIALFICIIIGIGIAEWFQRS